VLFRSITSPNPAYNKRTSGVPPTLGLPAPSDTSSTRLLDASLASGGASTSGSGGAAGTSAFALPTATASGKPLGEPVV